MVVLHASDAPSVYLQARARMTRSSPADIGRELYEERTALRMLAMRRTLFLVPLADVPIVNAAASRAIATNERRRTLGMLADSGIGPDPAALMAELEAVGLAEVRRLGEATTAELGHRTRAWPRRSPSRAGSPGRRPSACRRRCSSTSPLTAGSGAAGHVAAGSPASSIGARSNDGCPMASPICRWRLPGPSSCDAGSEPFGPGTRDDIKWWTGWTVAAVRQALAAIEAVEVDLEDGETGYLLPDDLEPVAPPDPWVALLPALDPTTMGWKGRDWYLGPHRPVLFDSNGNAGPTIWADGRIVGGWTQDRDGVIALHVLEDVGAETRRHIDAEAARLQEWLGTTRVRMSFPPPLGRSTQD